MSRTAVLRLCALLLVPATASAELSPDIQKLLADSPYVYISSTRKDGTLGAPAEIWFLWHDGAVYVGTPPASWRVKRIKAGRPDARIAVGKSDGPSFMATGSLVRDPKIDALILDTFARKYPSSWATHADNFRNGFKDGRRVVVKYVPKS